MISSQALDNTLEIVVHPRLGDLTGPHMLVGRCELMNFCKGALRRHDGELNACYLRNDVK